MLVKDESGVSGRSTRSSTDALMQLNGVMMGSSVKNEVYILQSHQLMLDVVRRLHLDVIYTYKQGLREQNLYDEKPFTVYFTPEWTDTVVTFDVTISGNKAEIGKYKMLGEEHEFTKKIDFDKEVTLPFGTFILVKDSAKFEAYNGKTITITHTTIESAANMYGSNLSSGELDKESTLVGLSYTDTSIKRAEDILNAVLDSYKESIIMDKNRIAASTAQFINRRIDIISEELSSVESELARFKQQNNIVDLGENAAIYLQQSNTARQRSINLESQMRVVEYLLRDLKDNTNSNSLIPSLGGITDAALQSQISKYNELMLERNRLISNTGQNSTYITQINEQLSQMHRTIIASTEANLSSLRVQLTRSREEENLLSISIANVPDKEKKALDITRQQNIKETLYTFLLNKREETELQLAITEANIRIIEKPYGNNIPISPRSRVVIIVSLILGIVLPFVFFYVRNMLNMGVRGRKDIETYTNIPVLGEIPHRKEGINDSEILVGEQKTDSINEAFRMLRYSLGFIQKDARVIMFTSTMPGEGKTFISRNFAVSMGITGKKVLLLDTDIRKRTQSKLSGTTHREGLTSYLSGSTDDISSLIIQEASIIS